MKKDYGVPLKSGRVKTVPRNATTGQYVDKTSASKTVTSTAKSVIVRHSDVIKSLAKR
jgi:hypothetical protein